MLSCYESHSDRLRPHGHNHILPTCTNSLHRQSFINRSLFDFVWYLLYCVCLILFTVFTTIGINSLVMPCFYLLYYVRFPHELLKYNTINIWRSMLFPITDQGYDKNGLDKIRHQDRRIAKNKCGLLFGLLHVWVWWLLWSRSGVNVDLSEFTTDNCCSVGAVYHEKERIRTHQRCWRWTKLLCHHLPRHCQHSIEIIDKLL